MEGDRSKLRIWGSHHCCWVSQDWGRISVAPTTAAECYGTEVVYPWLSPLLLSVTGLRSYIRVSHGQFAQFDTTCVDPENGGTNLYRKIGKTAKFQTVGTTKTAIILLLTTRELDIDIFINPLNPELNPICYLLALLAHHFLHFSRLKVKLLTFRRLMFYIYIWSTHSWCF